MDEHLDELYSRYDPTALPRVLSRAAARRRGFTSAQIDHRLASGRWRRVLPRTYLTAGTLTWPDRLDAALEFGGPAALISGAAALADDLDAVRRPRSILLLVPYGSAPRSTGWVQVRPTVRMPSRRLTQGPARANVARAVADLALVRPRVDDVRALVTEAVRRGLCTVPELAAELESGPRRGSAHLRRAIAEAADGAWSAPEARAATVLRRHGVPRFEQNARLDLPDGRYLVADFLWRDLRAILEIDGHRYHSLPGDRDGTDGRHLLLETLGYSVVHRSPWMVVNRPGRFVAEIQAWLAGRAARSSARRSA